MQPQSYENHAKIVTMYHRVLFGIIAITLIGSFVNLYQSIGDHSRLYNASLICAISVSLALLFVFCRVFPLKAQDRAIRAEEQLRHYLLTGKALDPKLTLSQIVGLRFASDEEFPALAAKAAAEGLSLKAVKRSIKSWRADYDRL